MKADHQVNSFREARMSKLGHVSPRIDTPQVRPTTLTVLLVFHSVNETFRKA